MTSSPIYQTTSDRAREDLVASFLRGVWPSVEFWPNPKFYPTDFHLVEHLDSGHANYLGDLEVKWFNHGSDRAGVFNYNKLLRILLMETPQDDDRCFHRLAARFDDGVYVVPIRALAALTPEVFTRQDTGERDLIVRLHLDTLPGKWFDGTVS